jgi:uncharacterized membrane protein YccF (DUF307 family)
MPAAATAARKHIRILDIVTLRLSSTCWRVAKTSHLCLRATALMQIKIQPFVKLIARADEVIE